MIHITPETNSELAAMLEQANRPDLIREGFDLDDDDLIARLAEQESLHAGASDEWKRAHAAYSAYFARRAGVPQIEIDAPKSAQDQETRTIRALNVLLHEGVQTRELFAGHLRLQSDALIQSDNAGTSRIVDALQISRDAGSIDTTHAALTIASKLTELGLSLTESIEHSTSESSLRAALADKNARRSQLIGWLQFAALVALFLLFAVRGHAQTPVAGIGTAGTPKGGVVSIQGVSGGQVLPVSGTVTVTPSGTQAVSNAGTFAVQNTAATPAGSNVIGHVINDASSAVIGHVIADSGSTTAVTALPATPAGTNLIGIVKTGDGTSTAVIDPCSGNAKLFYVISITASTQVITGTSAKKTYICAINLVAAAATNVALVEGTGTVCATGIAGMAGGTTAATGWNLAANGGLTLGSGAASVMATATNADNVCLLVSAANQISGTIAYAVQ